MRFPGAVACCILYRLIPMLTRRSDMKKSIFLVAMLTAVLIGTAAAQAPAGGQARGGRPNIFAPEPTATGPIADVVKGIVTAFNNRDSAYFQKAIASDAV